MFIDLLGLAWGQMRANLRRSLLALIGVVIGVGVLAALGDLGRLTQAKTTASLAKLGLADVISVQLGQADQRLIDPQTSARLEASLPFVKAVSALAVILADEPTGNLDQASGAQIMDLFGGLNEQGMTIVLVTHDPTLAHRCPVNYHLADGRLVEANFGTD